MSSGRGSRHVQLENIGSRVVSLGGVTAEGCGGHPQIERVHFDRWSECCLVSPVVQGLCLPFENKRSPGRRVESSPVSCSSFRFFFST